MYPVSMLRYIIKHHLTWNYFTWSPEKHIKNWSYAYLMKGIWSKTCKYIKFSESNTRIHVCMYIIQPVTFGTNAHWTSKTGILRITNIAPTLCVYVIYTLQTCLGNTLWKKPRGKTKAELRWFVWAKIDEYVVMNKETICSIQCDSSIKSGKSIYLWRLTSQ